MAVLPARRRRRPRRSRRRTRPCRRAIPGARWPSRCAAASASGIEAAEVFAVHSTLKETFSCGHAERVGDGGDDPRVGLVGDEVVDVVERSTPLRSSTCARGLGHARDGVAVDLLTGHPQLALVALGVERVGERRRRSRRRTRRCRAPWHARADERGAGAVAEEDGRGAVLVVGDRARAPRRRRRARAGAAALDQRGGVVEPVEEAGAGGVEVDDAGVRRRRSRAATAGARPGVSAVGGDRRDDHVVDVGGRRAGVGERVGAGGWRRASASVSAASRWRRSRMPVRRTIHSSLVSRRATSVGVGDQLLRQRGADAEDRRTGACVAQARRRAHPRAGHSICARAVTEF